MSGLITYSSRTGNTLQVAEAIREVLPSDTEFVDVTKCSDVSRFDWMISAFWVDRGEADAATTTFFKKLSGKKIGLIGTLGASPDSDHARNVEKAIRDVLELQNYVLGCFMCLGRIDPALAEQFKALPPDHPHGWTPEREKRHAVAASHPDAVDLKSAQDAALRFTQLAKKTLDV